MAYREPIRVPSALGCSHVGGQGGLFSFPLQVVGI